MANYDYYRNKIETAYLEQGKAVYGIASGSALAALVPVPGFDIAVDIPAMIAFANACLTKFGLTEEELKEAGEHIAMHAMKKAGGKAAMYGAQKALEKAVVKEAVEKALLIAKRKVFIFLEQAGIMAIVKKVCSAERSWQCC